MPIIIKEMSGKTKEEIKAVITKEIEKELDKALNVIPDKKEEEYIPAVLTVKGKEDVKNDGYDLETEIAGDVSKIIEMLAEGNASIIKQIAEGNEINPIELVPHIMQVVIDKVKGEEEEECQDQRK